MRPVVHTQLSGSTSIVGSAVWRKPALSELTFKTREIQNEIMISGVPEILNLIMILIIRKPEKYTPDSDFILFQVQ